MRTGVYEHMCIQMCVLFACTCLAAGFSTAQAVIMALKISTGAAQLPELPGHRAALFPSREPGICPPVHVSIYLSLRLSTHLIVDMI